MDAFKDYKDARSLCRDQREARREICDTPGEAPYDPEIDPNRFVDFEAVIEGREDFFPNAYFPLVPGSKRI